MYDYFKLNEISLICKSTVLIFFILALFIINSPKNAQPTYINFDDICYSQIGPRAPQVFLIHIQQW